MKPEVKKFIKTAPCNKGDLWKAFHGRRGWKSYVQTDIAHSIIGLAAPRNMLAKGYAEKVHENDSDRYLITDTGKAWLRAGFVSYLKKHPEAASHVGFVPKTILADAGITL